MNNISQLVVLVDIDSLVSGINSQDSRKDGLNTYDLTYIVSSLTLFFHSYLIMERGNEIAVIGYYQGGFQFLYPSTDTSHPRIIHRPLNYNIELDTNIVKPKDKENKKNTQEANEESLVLSLKIKRPTKSSITSASDILPSENSKKIDYSFPIYSHPLPPSLIFENNEDYLLPKSSPDIATFQTHMFNEFSKIVKQQQEYHQSTSSSGSTTSSSSIKSKLSNSLSLALTFINRRRKRSSSSRILSLMFDKDSPQNYNSIMNCIFSAQKLNIVIDTLILSSFESHLMQVCFYFFF